MLENLTSLVKQFAGDSIINNPAIPNEKNDEAVATASSSIIDTLKNAISGGNLSGITQMFSGGNPGNSDLAQQAQSGVAQQLMAKFGLDQSQADNAAGGLVPNVMSHLVSKTNDPNDNSFHLSDILTHLTGGAGGGLNVQDLLSKFTGGGEGNASGGGILGTIKGLFGK
ncbi:MAG: hypothetical protein V4450_10510 [Bacteroidota bacterium]